MIPPEKRAANIYARGDLLAVIPLDRDPGDRLTERPGPDVLNRKTASAEEIGRSVIAALISNHADAPAVLLEDLSEIRESVSSDHEKQVLDVMDLLTGVLSVRASTMKFEIDANLTGIRSEARQT